MAATIRIGEAARRTSLSVDAIRFYERRGFVQTGAEDYDLFYRRPAARAA